MNKLFILFALGSVSSAFGNYYGQGSCPNCPRNQGNYQDRSYEQNVQGYNANSSNSTDQQINKNIQDTVGSGWFSKGYENISFDVNNGIVTLRGSVDSMDDKRKIEDKIRNLNGVRQVNNQIQVRGNQQGYNNPSDQQVNKNIQDTVGSGWFSKGYENVSFDVNNGIVTLKGTVDSIDDKRKIEDKVKALDGVRQVNNLIQVGGNQQGNNNSSDQETSKQIHGTLSAGWLHNGHDDISYEINNGNVTLRGTVDTNQDKNDIQVQVERVDGVRQVDNKIKVNSDNKNAQDFAASPQDERINADIRSKLEGGWISRGFEGIILKTNNGIVVITGSIDNSDDSRKIEDKIKTINGVRSVKNQLMIRAK